MRNALILICFLAASLHADSIQAFGHTWDVLNSADWKLTSTPPTLELLTAMEPDPAKPRRPRQFALLQSEPFEEVTIDLEVKRNGKSLIIVFAWQDEAHFNYAHLSVDDPTKQPVHNGIFHVFGGERVRISYPQPGPGVLPSQDWTPVRFLWNGKDGEVRVFVNGQLSSALRGIDLSLKKGRIGLGSFNETASFRNVRIKGS